MRLNINVMDLKPRRIGRYLGNILWKNETVS